MMRPSKGGMGWDSDEADWNAKEGKGESGAESAAGKMDNGRERWAVTSLLG